MKKTQYWHITGPGDPRISEAGRIIREGGLVAFPTETVYGLGANGLDDTASAGIYRAKGRPADNPLILHVASLADARALTGSWNEKAQLLVNKLWPGPLTIVMPAAGHIPRTVTAGLATVAIRYPSEPIAQALIEAAGVPVAAPSANTSGRPSPTRADHVLEDMDGKIDVIIDGGPCKVGLESTILDLTVDPPEILRPGNITRETLSRLLGEIRGGDGPDEEAPDEEAPGEEAPGEEAPGEGAPGEEAQAGGSVAGLFAGAGAGTGADTGADTGAGTGADTGAGGHNKESAPSGTPKAPGMKYRHYAPLAPAAVLQGAPPAVADFVAALLLSPPGAGGKKQGARRRTGLLLSEETWRLLASAGLFPEKEAPAYYCRNMGGHSNPGEMGLLLYDALRSCDKENVDCVYVEACDAEGKGAAVLNRLHKACGNRIIRLP